MQIKRFSIQKQLLIEVDVQWSQPAQLISGFWTTSYGQTNHNLQRNTVWNSIIELHKKPKTKNNTCGKAGQNSGNSANLQPALLAIRQALLFGKLPSGEGLIPPKYLGSPSWPSGGTQVFRFTGGVLVKAKLRSPRPLEVYFVFSDLIKVIKTPPNFKGDFVGRRCDVWKFSNFV